MRRGEADAATGAEVFREADLQPVPGVEYERLRHAIRADILTGRFPSGERLKVAELARIYDSSPVPVREALQTLVGEGLVTLLPHRGAVVRRIDRKFMDGVFELLQALEPFVNRRFLDNASIDTIDELARLQDGLEAAEDSGDMPSRFSHDQRFHALIVRTTGNAEAMHLHERHHNIVGAHLLKFGQTDSRRRQVRSEHRDQIAALCRGDAVAASDVSIRHLVNAHKDISTILDSVGGSR